MSDVYHSKIKEEHATALIDDLIKNRCREDLPPMESKDLPCMAKTSLGKRTVSNY